MTDSEYNDLLENLDGIIQGRLNVYACFTIYFNIFTDVSLLLHTYVLFRTIDFCIIISIRTCMYYFILETCFTLCIISYLRLVLHYYN